ncbi:MAG: sulfite exporter TauE/SafE family protein [Gammaproteobacteria bacterium]
MVEVFMFSLLAGALGGLLAGLFGIGGGLVLVPMLALLFGAQNFPADLVMIMAVATSLATIVITSVFSIIAHHRLGAVVWRQVYHLAPGIVVGAVIGAMIADFISGEWLRYIFVAFLFYVGAQLAFQITPGMGELRRSLGLDVIVACIIGILSALLGIGGGTLTVPYLVSCRYPIRNAVAISSACGFPIAVAGTLSYAALGSNQSALPDGSLGYVYMPAFIGIVLCSSVTAPWGAQLAHSLPGRQLKRYFSVLIFVMAFKLIWQ